MTLDDCREFYAEEIRIAARIHSPALVAAYARVPRERFMGPGPWQIASAESASMTIRGRGDGFLTTDNPKDLYHNVLVALDPDRHLNNGQPSALARWIDALDLKAGERVYHLGCGVGYYTAIIAEVAGAGGRVLASEVDPVLAARAQENLAVYPNVFVHAGDGAAFDPGECDAIFINAGVTHPHPVWLQRLSPNGRIVLPLTSATDGAFWGSGVVAKVARERNGFSARVLTPVAIYSCLSVRDPAMNAKLAKALATKALANLKSVRIDPHEEAETCLAHRTDLCLSTCDAAPCDHSQPPADPPQKHDKRE
jgi:protein-L-isoaspartate(D-aspartate) O-methyltransferase